jgi:hypothetical protein
MDIFEVGLVPTGFEVLIGANAHVHPRGDLPGAETFQAANGLYRLR